MGPTGRRACLIGLALVIALPLLGTWIRRSGKHGCALDGMRIDPHYRVRIEEEDRRSHEFCCIRCAEIWLDRQKARPRTIHVTDEASGREILAKDAYFVRSLVYTMKTTENRVHAFANKTDAENHARDFRGTLLTESERPFGPSRD